MRDLGPLYAIDVIRETYDSDWSGRKDEWDALTHCYIRLQPAMDPADNHDYTPGELLAAYVWAAGPMARAALRLTHMVRWQARKDGCPCVRGLSSDQESCGEDWSEYIELNGPADAVRDRCRPSIDIWVPKNAADTWLRKFQAHLNMLLAGDLLPVGLQQPERHNEHHGNAVPGTPTPTAVPRGVNT